MPGQENCSQELSVGGRFNCWGHVVRVVILEDEGVARAGCSKSDFRGNLRKMMGRLISVKSVRDPYPNKADPSGTSLQTKQHNNAYAYTDKESSTQAY